MPVAFKSLFPTTCDPHGKPKPRFFLPNLTDDVQTLFLSTSCDSHGNPKKFIELTCRAPMAGDAVEI